MSSLTGPVLAEYQDLFTSTTTQGGPNGGLQLGAKSNTGDGREFRFCLAGGTSLVVGQLQQSAAETTAWELVTPAVTAKGATTITITSSLTVAVNALAGGYMVIGVTPGVGYTYKIVSNTAVTSAANMVVTLEDPIQVALTATSRVSFLVSPYGSVIVYPTTATGFAVGVAIYPITNAQYGWLQVTGACATLIEGSCAVGAAVSPSETTAGAGETADSNDAVIGQSMMTQTSTDYGLVWLNIG